MDSRTFDILTRRAVGALTRRSLAGTVTGAILAIAVFPLGALAKKGKGGKGKKRKRRCVAQASACLQEIERFCNNNFPPFSDEKTLCVDEGMSCCGYYLKCDPTAGDQCIDDFDPLPYTCPNEGDVLCGSNNAVRCCPASTPICPLVYNVGSCCPANAAPCQHGGCANEGFTCCNENAMSCPLGDVCCRSDPWCCPPSFPICPPAGRPSLCCPTDAPIPCENGSCTKDGFTCCPNNSGSCRDGTVCCDNDRCCPGGHTCVGADLCVPGEGPSRAAASEPFLRVKGHSVTG